jgi:pyruvate/2-oxoglutarate dehydrogenase complex dihydrolipoamide dehydrogenase (E3) component
LPQWPKAILIQGGGYIALEFAGIFAGLGSKVILVHRGDNVLRMFDEDTLHSCQTLLNSILRFHDANLHWPHRTSATFWCSRDYLAKWHLTRRA